MKAPNILMAMGLLAIASLAHAQKIDALDLEQIKTTSVKLVRFEAPKLFVMTPKDAVGEGLIARITKSDEADGKISEVRYYPDRLLMKELDSLLRAGNWVDQLNTVEEPMEFAMPKEVKNTDRYTGLDEEYVFEIYVPNGLTWAASYTGMNWKKYSLTLGAELRIYRVSDSELLHKDYAYLGGLNDKRLKFKPEELGDDAPEKIQGLVAIAAKEIAVKWIEKLEKAK